MEVVEMDHMVLDILDTVNEIPDDPCVVRDYCAYCIFHGSHGALCVDRCSDPSYSRDKRPALPRVPPFCKNNYFSRSSGFPFIALPMAWAATPAAAAAAMPRPILSAVD